MSPHRFFLPEEIAGLKIGDLPPNAASMPTPSSPTFRVVQSSRQSTILLSVAVLVLTATRPAPAVDDSVAGKDQPDPVSWREEAVDYARIMSHVKWTPVADTMPKRGGHFEAGKEYTGVPYSSVKHVGRYIGFDIYLKTFLAAAENPLSVLYTENLHGKVKNAETYYGKVCSSYTSYALQCGIWYVSRLHGPPYRDGVEEVTPATAPSAEIGDVIYTPPAKKGGGSHVEMVTEVVRDAEGGVTHVRIEESRPETTSDTLRSAKAFDAHLAARNRKLYRITDLDAWRGGNRADALRFPNYEEDSATPVINRVLLLDRGDWVPYHKSEPVKIHVMDRDDQGVEALVIRRGDEMFERIEGPGKGVLERTFSICGDYTVHAELSDGSRSQACEFAVCEMDVRLPEEPVSRAEPWEIEFRTDNLDVAIVYLKSVKNGWDEHNVFVTERDRERGRVTIPAGLIEDPGRMQVWVFGENRYGRLKEKGEILVEE
ncbi:MAG: hypothetical protein WD342_16895 [Verrucomicrobiales bacterium]